MQRIIEEEVNRMFAEGVIEPSESLWSSPIVIAKKKEEKAVCTKRLCPGFPIK